jgi:hypothetical protein
MIKTTLLLSAMILTTTLAQAGTCRIKTSVKVERDSNPQYLYCLGDIGDPFSDEYSTSRSFKRFASSKEECQALAESMLGEEVAVRTMESYPLGMVILAPMEPRYYECNGVIEKITKVKFKAAKTSKI